VAGQWVSDIPVSSSDNWNKITPYGTTYSFQGVTFPWLGVIVLNQWPTYLITNNVRMPAYWNFQFEHPSYCHSASAPYALLPNPYMLWAQVENPSFSAFKNPALTFYCYTNTPATADFDPAEVNPQFVLDNALPDTVRVSSISPITADASNVNLRVFSTSLTNPTNVTAYSVASDGMSAVFPYPRASNGGSIAPGAYITTTTSDVPGSNQETNGMEPIYIAHNDTSFTSAFGVAATNTSNTITTSCTVCDAYFPYSTTENYGGGELPIVTLPQRGMVAVGSMSNLIQVGSLPTVVIPYNDQTVSTSNALDACTLQTFTWTGAQSALVVNTGSNSVSLINIGGYSYPTGTVSVGTQPVAAVIDSSGTTAYIANYGDGSISQIDLSSVSVSRTLSINPHPTSVSFDSNGNLWVGGQGYLQLINLTNWSVSSTFAVDGTVTGMNYDTKLGNMVVSLLKNGSSVSPVNGITAAAQIAYSATSGTSYSTYAQVNVASGNTVAIGASGDASPYLGSALATSLAFPGQTAFSPLIYKSSTQDLVATAAGNTFTVSEVSTGKTLLTGSTPYPIRGIWLTSTMLYATMPDSNSLITLPLRLP
jgi:DNA-binding beta-propeller fold protein YncE